MRSMASPDWSELSHERNAQNEDNYFDLLRTPTMTYVLCYALCRAWELLTTRMPVLRMCVACAALASVWFFGGVISIFR